MISRPITDSVGIDNRISFTLDGISYAEVMFLYALRKKLHTTFLKTHATPTPAHFKQNSPKKVGKKLPYGKKIGKNFPSEGKSEKKLPEQEKTSSVTSFSDVGKYQFLNLNPNHNSLSWGFSE